jgi:hypothetical protein
MPRTTPIKDFLFRLQVDSDFANRVLDPQQRADALQEYGLDDATRNAIEEPTPITDFLFRLEVDSDFVSRVLDEEDEERRNSAFDEYELNEQTRTAIVNKDFGTLQSLVDEEHPDRVHILPRGWVA